MEHIIARLLDQFEHGRLSRRQLIHRLALTATAASTINATASPDHSPFKAISMNHISYQVADYAKTRDFYVELLGMTPSKDDGKQVNLNFGNAGAYLLARNARQPGTAPKVDHVAYTIEPWDQTAVKAELDRRGLNPRPDTDLSFHVKDPDGYDVQIATREPA